MQPKPRNSNTGLYTDEQRRRRDASPWTLVQAVLAPAQFIVFLLSLWLVMRYIAGGEGYALAAGSVVLKTAVLYTIMVTGALWEKDVFGQYLFAEPFFWEDVFSMLVIALHTAYLVALAFDIGDPRAQLGVALAGYGAYVINAGQFVWKLRQARLQSASKADDIAQPAGAAT